MQLRHPFGYLWLNIIVFYSALIAGCLMAFSPNNMGLQPQMNDKLLHAFGFFVIAILSHLAHPDQRNILLIIGLALFGMAIELIQAYLPYRTFSFWDWCADVLGLLLYFLLLAKALMHLLSRDRIG